LKSQRTSPAHWQANRPLPCKVRPQKSSAANGEKNSRRIDAYCDTEALFGTTGFNCSS
jgi:hypothetical protein